jgi:hypothetical protein
MILEAIVTSRNEDRTTNVSPMGPNIETNLSRFELRPFNTSRTFQNLKRTRQGVLHITDDVDLIARAAIGKLDPPPGLQRAEQVDCDVIREACRWYEFRVEFIEEVGPRASLNCKTIYAHRNRDFFGFNRAKHAVLEAAILATRIHFLPAEEIALQFQRLEPAVKKTGGSREQNAFRLLQEFIQSAN